MRMSCNSRPNPLTSYEVSPLWQSELAQAICSRSKERWKDAAPTVMIGRDPRFVAVLDKLERLSGSDGPVLISGETGTGKELFARGLYLLSRRNGRPFLRVNCAQYHDGQLMASELFGHRKGSFTGAIRDHVGLFESASTGIVFLDEVAELPLHAQAMLLRALSEGEVVPIGETVPRRVDVRVIAATSMDMGSLVRNGRFRRDLYYRLRGMHLEVPPVRERGRDWELIADYYLRNLEAARARQKRFSAESREVLSRYAWPGNIRELKALVDSGFHLSEGELIEPRHFLESLEQAARLEQLETIPLLDAGAECYDRMTRGEGNFWELVYRPYLERELSRSQVRAVLARGLAATLGSYKRLLQLFGIAPEEYPRFMDFLRHHKLKPSARELSRAGSDQPRA
jgi:transcriptional regulator with GAF, ATPase, and Fis domain